jgi:hypothetical protein
MVEHNRKLFIDYQKKIPDNYYPEVNRIDYQPIMQLAEPEPLQR